jgi:uncharacterized protein YvpB
MIRLRRPAVVAVGLLTLMAAVAIPLWTLAQATTSQATAATPPAANAGTPTQQATGNGAVALSAPIIKQDLALDCEAAALQVALAVQHITVPQDQIYAGLPQDLRSPTLGPDGYPARWGDPFSAFVGDVHGYEPSFTGYGVYYPPIVTAADRYGARADGHTGWTIAEVIAQLRAGNSVIIWLTSDFKAHTPRYWTAWDGRHIPWAIGEHAVPVIGYDPLLNTLTVVDVLYGTERSFTTTGFAAAMTTFDGMGVAVARQT